MLGQGLLIVGWIGIDCSENMVLSRRNWLLGHWLHYGRLVGVPLRAENGLDELDKKEEAVSRLGIWFG